MLVTFAAICSALAVLTGILAVGKGEHWHFKVSDYFRGKRNALIYLWVIGSTTFSLVHTMMLLQYGADYNWTPVTPQDAKWFVLHAATGILFILAHLFVTYTLNMEVGPVDKFLWGKNRRAVS